MIKNLLIRVKDGDFEKALRNALADHAPHVNGDSFVAGFEGHRLSQLKELNLEMLEDTASAILHYLTTTSQQAQAEGKAQSSNPMN